VAKWMKSYAGPGTSKMAKCIMPLLVATVETLAAYTPNPPPYRDPFRNTISGRCCWGRVCEDQISIPATRNLGACVLFVLHASLSPLSGIVCCLSLRRSCTAQGKNIYNISYVFRTSNQFISCLNEVFSVSKLRQAWKIQNPRTKCNFEARIFETNNARFQNLKVYNQVWIIFNSRHICTKNKNDLITE